MPGFNGKGPKGQGAGAGLGRGPCGAGSGRGGGGRGLGGICRRGLDPRGAAGAAPGPEDNAARQGEQTYLEGEPAADQKRLPGPDRTI